MKVKSRLLTNDNFDLNTKVPNLSNVILGDKIIVPYFPNVVEVITVATILEGVNRDNNIFDIKISNLKGEELGQIKNYISKSLALTGEAILCYRFAKLTFQSEEDFYEIELLNKGKLIEKYRLSATTSYYDIYENYDIFGVIPALKK